MTDTPRKRGRPPVAPEKQRRGRLAVAVKFSSEEYTEIRESAEKAGQSVPDHLLARMRQ